MSDLSWIQTAAYPNAEASASDVLRVLRMRRSRITEAPIDPYQQKLHDQALARLRLLNGEQTLRLFIEFASIFYKELR